MSTFNIETIQKSDTTTGQMKKITITIKDKDSTIYFTGEGATELYHVVRYLFDTYLTPYQIKE